MIAALLVAAWSFIVLKFRKSGWFKNVMIRLLKREQKKEN
jgi:hypothetical protein